MDKFLTFAGTQPIYLGDVDFMQASSAGMLKLLARALMNSDSNSLNAILQGIEITQDGANVTFSPGIVVLNGEILPFEGTTITSASHYYFHVESTFSGERTFKSGETHDCYEVRKAVINTTSASGVDVDVVTRLHDASDAVYTIAGVDGFVSSASMIVRDNICYLKFDYNSTPGQGTTAMIAVDVIPALAQALQGKGFPAAGVTIYLGGQEIQPFIIGVSTVLNQVQFHISCEWASEHSGEGTCYVTIPIFNL